MDETIFKDKYGREWTKETLDELIETLTILNKALDRVSYYK